MTSEQESLKSQMQYNTHQTADTSIMFCSLYNNYTIISAPLENLNERHIYDSHIRWLK